MATFELAFLVGKAAKVATVEKVEKVKRVEEGKGQRREMGAGKS
jgi:hypothetical protein